MSLQHLILALLKDEPLSGYDLDKRITDTIEHFWTTNRSQVYRSLYKMHEAGWLEIETIVQTDNPSKKIYHLTDAGRDELTTWMTQPVPEEPLRLAWVAQIYFADLLSAEQFITLLEGYEARERAYLEGLEEAMASYPMDFSSPQISPQELSRLLSLDVGIAGSKAMIEWCEKAKRIVEVHKNSYTKP